MGGSNQGQQAVWKAIGYLVALPYVALFYAVVVAPLWVWSWLWRRTLVRFQPWRRWALSWLPHVVAGIVVGVPWLATQVGGFWAGPGARALAYEAWAGRWLSWWATGRVRAFQGWALNVGGPRGDVRTIFAVLLMVVVLAVVAMALQALASAVALGPVWAAWVARTGPKEDGRLVAGRERRRLSAGDLAYWQAKADAGQLGGHLVGVSLTHRVRVGLVTRAAPVLAPWSMRVRHLQNPGITGSGKTESVLMPLALTDIREGRGLVFIDPKGSTRVRDTLYAAAAAAGRAADFRVLDLLRPERSGTYSPVRTGRPAQQLERLMDAMEWSHPHYRTVSAKALGRVLAALSSTGRLYTLDDVLLALESGTARQRLAQEVPDLRVRQQLVDLVGADPREYANATSGLTGQLENLLASDFGPLLMDPDPTVKLADVYACRQLLYVAAPAEIYPQTAPMLARYLVADVGAVAAEVEAGSLNRSELSVIVDEFGAVATLNTPALLARVRSAGIGVSLGHQSLTGDLRPEDRGYAERVIANTGSRLVLAQSGADAEAAATLAGTRQTTSETVQLEEGLIAGHRQTGMRSSREVEEFILHPQDVRTMPVGRGAWLGRGPGGVEVDLVQLPRVDLSVAPAWEPPPGPRGQNPGLGLRQLVAAAAEVKAQADDELDQADPRKRKKAKVPTE
jgi:TraM recognition site of TraD and TraG